MGVGEGEGRGGGGMGAGEMERLLHPVLNNWTFTVGMADVWTSFRRRFHVAALTKRNHVRVASLHDIYKRSTSTHAQTIPRAKSVDYLNFCCQSEEEMEEIWKANLMVWRGEGGFK